MRLTDLLSSNGDGLTAFQYQSLKKRFPKVVLYSGGEPQFRDKPKTREEAVNWIKNLRLVGKYEAANNLDNLPKKLILVPKDRDVPDIETHFITMYNIKPKEL